MRILKSLGVSLCALIALAALMTATPAQAQEPHYLHALSNLRTARDYIQFDRGQFNGERRHAVDEINKAIEEIKHAAWDDGKNTNFAPPAQGVTSGWAPMHQAIHWLVIAKADVAEGVDTHRTRDFGTGRFFILPKRYASLTLSGMLGLSRAARVLS
jgi:hypothetical protein